MPYAKYNIIIYIIMRQYILNYMYFSTVLSSRVSQSVSQLLQSYESLRN